MNRDEAREYFKNSGLSYSDIEVEDIATLNNFLAEELDLYLKEGTEHAKAMDMKVRKPLAKDLKVLKRTGLKYAFLKVRGSYFDSREAISFNENGFIGFGGELDSKNVQPILRGFRRWVDLLVS
ncbi:hypothetical protein MKX29_24395 [Cytobacillus sp. FSL R7-0696]|uniref:hypothetical protein n=1 Tax=Cytobacillus sp. FSL R7-0696 TaxID=2921691 RepID=UPI0030F67D18